MSRARLGNAELRFYTDSGGSETTKIKLVPTNNILTLQGASAGTQVKLSNLSDPTNLQDASTKSVGDARAGSEAAAVLSRATDSDTAAEMNSASVFISKGTLGTGVVQASNIANATITATQLAAD